MQHTQAVFGQHGQKPKLVGHGRAEQRRQPGLVQHRLQHLGAELLGRKARHRAQGNGLGVAHG
jgi:hypothetical protein